MENTIKLLASTVGQESLPPVGAIPDPGVTGVAQGTLLDYIQNTINWTLGFIGIIVFILIIYAGFMYLTAGGNQGQAESSVKILTNTVIGALILFFAFVLTNAIIGFVFQV